MEYEVTLSVTDLTKVEALKQAYESVGSEALVRASQEPAFFSSFARAASRAESYGGNNDTQGYTNMVDMGDLVRKSGESLLPTSAQALLTALDDAV